MFFLIIGPNLVIPGVEMKSGLLKQEKDYSTFLSIKVRFKNECMLQKKKVLNVVHERGFNVKIKYYSSHFKYLKYLYKIYIKS